MAKTTETTKKTNNTQEELQELQKELQELQGTVKKLTSSLRNDGASKIADVKGSAHDARLAAAERWSMLRDKGAEGLHSTEDAVREKPVRSLGLAFLGGVIASRLLQR